MGSSQSRRARQKISKTTFHRLQALHTSEGKLQDDFQASLIDVPSTDVLVATVPPSMSVAQASDLETHLSKAFQRPVIVLTNNVRLVRLEGPLDRREIKEALKGVDGNADEIVKQLLDGEEEPEEESYLEAKEAAGTANT